MLTSSFKGIPIGLGLALETLITPTDKRIDEDREIPKYNIRQYQGIFIDVFLITREVVNAIPKEEIKKHTPSSIGTKVAEVIQNLDEIDELMGALTYFNSYSGRFMKGKIFTEETITGFKNLLIQRTMLIINRFVKTPTNPMIQASNKLVITHHTYWMAKYIERYRTLSVLQSHTGKIYSEDELWRKYPKKKSYEREGLKLVPSLVIALGDGQLIKGVPSKELKPLYEVMKTWNKDTSSAVIHNEARKYI